MRLETYKGRVMADVKGMTDLGRLIAARREQFLDLEGDWEKWGVPAFSKKLRMDSSSIRRIESSQRLPSWEALKKIMDALGLEIVFRVKRGAPKLGGM